MNLNDCINRLPAVLRGRFSSSNNASWLNWASDGITQIERNSIGPGHKRQVMGWQLGSGFVPIPTPLRQITNAWLDGEEVPNLSAKDDRGFFMEEKATFSRAPADAVATEFEATVTVLATDGDFPARRTVIVTAFNITPRAIEFALTAGSALPAAANGMAGWAILLDDEILHLDTGTTTGDTASYLVSELSSTVISGFPAMGISLVGAEAGAIDGCEVHCGPDVVAIGAATWRTPQSTPAGWTSAWDFDCERAFPGRTFSTTAGFILKSNLVIEGYRKLARPLTMTDRLDLPEGYEDLMVSYLWWQAERSQDKGSRETATAMAEFEKALRQYAVDQSRTDGRTRHFAARFTPTFNNRNF